MSAPDPLPPPQPPEGALDHILGQLGLRDYEQAYSREDLAAARAELASLRALLEECEDALASARDTVSTHAMQTYSSVSRKEAEAIDTLLSKLRAARGSLAQTGEEKGDG